VIHTFPVILAIIIAPESRSEVSAYCFSQEVLAGQSFNIVSWIQTAKQTGFEKKEGLHIYVL
jgi:hypothetical protein